MNYNMKVTILNLMTVIIILMASCAKDPAKLVFGKDVCQFCKMTLKDDRFGAELVSDKEKVYKFDDIGCLVKFYTGHDKLEYQYSYIYVIDYAHPGEFIETGAALYVKSTAIKSPMAGNIAAFNDKTESERFNKDWKGSYLTWGEVVAQFK